jgi:hypothetical protein
VASAISKNGIAKRRTPAASKKGKKRQRRNVAAVAGKS